MTDVSELKAGDVVRCVDACGCAEGFLSKGHIYTVQRGQSFGLDLVILRGVSGTWSTNRFEKVTPFKPGDFAECVSDELTAGYLKDGRTYLVERTITTAFGEQQLVLAGVGGRFEWDAARFKKVTPTPRSQSSTYDDGEGFKTTATYSSSGTYSIGPPTSYTGFYVGGTTSVSSTPTPKAATPFADLGKSIGELVEKKQAAYGDSFGKAGQVMRILYPDGVPPTKLDDALTVVRVLDKLFRIATDRDALGESPWRDIAGYALLSIQRAEAPKAAAKDIAEEDF